jgi:hypothetical protein
MPYPSLEPKWVTFAVHPLGDVSEIGLLER